MFKKNKKIKSKFNNFHLVDSSPWPILISILILNLIISLFIKINFFNRFFSLSISFIYIFFLWTRDILRERVYQGKHSFKTQNSLKLGILLFIVSEIIFFLSFFWTFFHRALNPAQELGNVWPRWGISPIYPFEIPLLNTLILVSSGVRITYAHHIILNQNYNLSILWVILTVILGLYFTGLQIFEYWSATFSIIDSVYGSIFFVATGFHGLHILVGTLIILFSLSRLSDFHFSFKRHLIFEFSCWYWHFVDLIWLFLFISIYWWGF